MVDKGAATGAETTKTTHSPSDHPAVEAMSRYLMAPKPDLSIAANVAHSCAQEGADARLGLSSSEPGELVAFVDEALRDVSLDPAPLEDLWRVLAHTEALHMDELEEMVLAFLCAYPVTLASELLDAPLRQIALGQQLLEPEARHIKVTEARCRLSPRLERHRALAEQIAEEACTHMMQRSEILAATLLKRMDLNSDGCVTHDEFLRAAPTAIAVELQNIVLSASTEALLANPDFQDDFHVSIAETLGLSLSGG